MTLSREEILLEMGLGPIWKLRSDSSAPTGAEVPVTGTQARDVAAPRLPDLPEQAAAPSDLREEFGEARSADIGITSPPAKGRPEPGEAGDLEHLGECGEREALIARLGWDELESSIAACRACGLCAQRQQAVPGVGDRQADWLFIGEGPGAEEDARGEPFVGQAGKLLDAMLAAIDLKRGEDVYIANAVKCRPPNNRTPEASEMAACAPYLRRQIALIQPRVIVLLGRAAAHSLLGEDGPLGGLRGRAFSYAGPEGPIPVVVTYHPAYLLRTLPDKAKSWEDLCRARALVRDARSSGFGG